MREALAIAGLSIMFYGADVAGFILLIRGALYNPSAVVKGFLVFAAAIITLVIIARIAAILARAKASP